MKSPTITDYEAGAWLIVAYVCGLALLHLVLTPLWATLVAVSWSLGGVAVWVDWIQNRRGELVYRPRINTTRDALCWLTAIVFGPAIAVILYGE